MGQSYEVVPLGASQCQLPVTAIQNSDGNAAVWCSPDIDPVGAYVIYRAGVAHGSMVLLILIPDPA